jgi:putative FmdB family regulatory protein
MPLYEFSCQSCGRTFERILPVDTDPSELRCPSGHRNARRVYSAPSVVFKGSGFYATDHRSGSASSDEANKP